MKIKFLTDNFQDYTCEAEFPLPDSRAGHIYRQAVLDAVARRMEISLKEDRGYAVARWRLYGAANQEELQAKAREVLNKIQEEAKQELEFAERVIYYILTYAEWKERNP